MVHVAADTDPPEPQPVGPVDLWGRWDDRGRQAKEGLTLERITRAAVELANADGLAAVSMARVAQRLGFTTMALYRHVASKDELLLLMFNSAIGSLPELPAGAGWRESLEVWAAHLSVGVLRAPWVVEINPTGLNTPMQVALLDLGLQALAGTGLPDGEKAAVLLVVSGHVFSHARTVSDYQRTEQAGTFGTLFTAPDFGEKYPTLAAALQNGIFDDDGSAGNPDDLMFGLTLILDGVANRIAGYAGTSPVD